MTNEEMIRNAKDALVGRGEEVTTDSLKHEIMPNINSETPHPWPSYKEMQECLEQHQRSA